MEASPLLTVMSYNLICVWVELAWLYHVLSVRHLNSCIVIFVTLNLVLKVL